MRLCVCAGVECLTREANTGDDIFNYVSRKHYWNPHSTKQRLTKHDEEAAARLRNNFLQRRPAASGQELRVHTPLQGTTHRRTTRPLTDAGAGPWGSHNRASGCCCCCCCSCCCCCCGGGCGGCASRSARAASAYAATTRGMSSAGTPRCVTTRTVRGSSSSSTLRTPRSCSAACAARITTPTAHMYD